MDASSGKTTGHRLNRGGNRQANAALHRIVVGRMGHHQPTKDYIARRTAQGKSKKSIMRCLKRTSPERSTTTWSTHDRPRSPTTYAPGAPP